jgi:type I restriction enzyme R subunit
MPYNEADTRSKLIDPALFQSGWSEAHIKREETAGEVVVIAGQPRQKPGRIDYTLRLQVASGTQPVAVALIEAKAEDKPPMHGLDQAKRYARVLNVPFVFSANGHMFVEFDRFTGLTSAPRPMQAFPSPADLQRRYEQGKGFSLTSPAAKPLLTPYTGGEDRRRYYQDAAIRAVLERIAQGKNRALLSLATGAGKTFLAVNLMKRIADAGQLRKALFLCDRDELRTQAHGAFQNVFGADAAIVTGSNAQDNARVLIATYQTLGIDGESDAQASFLSRNYPPNYFSHIIIDECHRSAWGEWSAVLTRNSAAIQIGLTATPRQIEVPKDASTDDLQIQADNYRYFGEPVYEYTMAQAMEDGYLAACEIEKRQVDLDRLGLTIDDILRRNPTNAITGAPVTRDELRDLYEKTSFEDQVMLPDRVYAMCADLFAALLRTGGPEQKTIIFCARDAHADAVVQVMNNLYAAYSAEQGTAQVEPYAFKCTAANNGGLQLPDFRGSLSHHFVAATVDLLTTGVDVPVVENIVFFRYMRSPISFYQMIGRGTRINAATDKLMFRVYDYTDATRLFAEDFVTRLAAASDGAEGDGADRPARSTFPVIKVEGFDVQVTDQGTFIVNMVDGKAQPVELTAYKRQLATTLVAEAPTLEVFRSRWITPEERQRLLQQLPGGAAAARVVRAVERLEECDLYDVLAELAYQVPHQTRTERVGGFEREQKAWLASLPPTTAATIRAIARQFLKAGTEGLENTQLFQTPEVVQAGGLVALKQAGTPAAVLRETKVRMFAA